MVKLFYLFYIYCSFTLLVCGENKQIVRSQSRLGKKSGAGAGAAWKKSGAGAGAGAGARARAAKKLAGSPALQCKVQKLRVLRQILVI